MFPIYNKRQISEFLTYFSEINLIRKSSDDIKPIDMTYSSYDTVSPPLVIMHGLFGSKSNWTTKSKGYSIQTNPSRRVIAADTRNHGASPRADFHTYHHVVADMKALCDSLSFKQVALLGHSMGGRACMLFSLKYPERVEKLIVADISPVSGLPVAEFTKIIDILMSVKLPSNNVTILTATKMLDNELKPRIAGDIFRAFLLSNLVKRNDGSVYWKINLPVLKNNLKNLSNFPLEDTMKYEGPALFVAGSNSNFVPKTDHPIIMKYFPRAEIKYIHGAGHWLHYEKPQEFMNMTLEFLNRNM